jgi:hypothetical protein
MHRDVRVGRAVLRTASAALAALTAAATSRAYSPALLDGRMTPPADDRSLHFFEGHWSGLMDAPGVRVQDVEEVEWSTNRRFLLFRSRTIGVPVPFEKTMLLGRDSASGEYTLAIFDGTGCTAALRGTCEREVFRFRGTSCLGPMTLIFEEENPDCYRVRTSFVDAEGDSVSLPVVVRRRMAHGYVGPGG